MSTWTDSTELDRWRLGRHCPIHVYRGETPVATFHQEADAAAAVRDHNRDGEAALKASIEALAEKWEASAATLRDCVDDVRRVLGMLS